MRKHHADKRMYAGLIVLLLLMIVFGIYAIFKSLLLVEQANKLYLHPYIVGTNVRDVRSDLLQIHRDMKDVAVASSVEDMEYSLIDVDRLEREVLDKIKVLNDRFLGDKSKVREFEENFRKWKPIRNEVIKYASSGQPKLAFDITQGKGRKYVDDLLLKLDYLIKFANGKASEFRERSADEGIAAIWTISVLLVVSIMASLVIAGFLMRSMNQKHRQMELLRESEENLATTVRSIGDGVIVTDLDGVVMQMNPVAEKLTGWSLQQAVGTKLEKVFRIINEDTRAEVINPVYKVLEHGGVIGMANHTVLLSRNGREIPIADSAAPIKSNDKGDIFGVVMVFRDQTEERMAEIQIRHLNQVLRSIRKVNQLITHCKDTKELLQETCDCLASTRGYNYVWLVSLDQSGNPLQFCQAGDSERFTFFAECIESGNYPNCVRRALSQRELCLIDNVHDNCSNCEFSYIKDRYTALVMGLWHGDRLFGILFAHMPEAISPSSEEQQLFSEVAVDIAYALHSMDQECRHRLMSRKVENQQQLLDLTGYMAKVGGWEYNIANEDFMYTNEVVRIHGLADLKNVTLEDLYECYQGDYCVALRTAVINAIHKSQSFNLELCMEKDGDDDKWIRATGRVICSDGNASYVAGTFQDVTERREIEVRLRQREKMEAVGQLAGGIAHDFNNQLACIMGYAELLSSCIKDPKLVGHANNIFLAASHSADLTKKLLAYSRKGKLLCKPVDLHSIVDEVVSFISHSFDKRIEVKQMLLAKNSTVFGDGSQLQNAILNLSLNARDAMPNGGQLSFSTRLVTLEDKAFEFDICSGRYIELCVGDTGCGISEKIIKRVYEPFFTTKELGKGTGLGLASVFGTVKAHKGAISIYSEVGTGTTFKLYIPVMQEKPQEVIAESPSSQIKVGNVRILVVDDEPMVCDLLSGMLERLGYKPVVIADPQKALEFYRESYDDIDLVILDMVMPELSGRDLFVQMKKVCPDVRAILSSGYSINDDVQQILEEGVLAFLQKPFQMSEISEVVFKALAF